MSILSKVISGVFGDKSTKDRKLINLGASAYLLEMQWLKRSAPKIYSFHLIYI